MTGRLEHEPSHIIRQLLLDLAFGSDPADDEDWPVFAVAMPDEPNKAILVSDTDGRTNGRYQITGETVEKYGIQFLVRSDELSGYSKTSRIASGIDKEVLRNEVFMENPDVTYRVNSIHKTSTIIRIGKERDAGGRWLWSLNCLASIQVVPADEAGTGS